MAPTEEDARIAIVVMSRDIGEMKSRDGIWHDQETGLLRDIKAAVNGRNSFMERLLWITVISLVVLAGAKAALEFLPAG